MADLEFETEWFSIESEKVKNSTSDKEKPFYRFKIPDSIMILPIRKDGKIILIRQYRQAVGSHTLELPCGQIEEGEFPEQAAERELLEETGYRCPRLDLIITGRPWIDRSDSKLHIFYGQEAEKDKNISIEENIEVVPVTTQELNELAMRNELQQLQSFAPIFLARLKFGLKI